MKKLISFLVLIVFAVACNNNAENKSVGDSMTKDPQTGQPITTEPDTVGPERTDSINQNNN